MNNEEEGADRLPQENEVFDVVSHYAVAPAGDMKLAKKEAKKLKDDSIRDREKADAWHQIFIWGIRVAAICLAIVFCVRVLHMIVPHSICWL